MYVCDNCGSSKIMKVMGVYVPMNEEDDHLEDFEGDAFFELDDYWCPACEACGVMWERIKEKG